MATFESDPALRAFFAQPWTPATVKRTVATEIAQRSGLSTLTSNFWTLVAGRGGPTTRDTVREARTGAAKSPGVLEEEIVDRTMLGDVIVESGGVVLDGSLEGQLEQMRRRLVSG